MNNIRIFVHKIRPTKVGHISYAENDILSFDDYCILVNEKIKKLYESEC